MVLEVREAQEAQATTAPRSTRLSEEQLPEQEREACERALRLSLKTSLEASWEPTAVEPPDHLVCPLSRSLFWEPVVASDGEIYKRAFIQRWIDDKQRELEEARQELEWDAANQRAARRLQRGTLSPTTNTPLAHTHLVPNNPLMREARAWARAHGVTLGPPSLSPAQT